MIGLGWLAYVRADYRDSANNESHNFLIFVNIFNIERLGWS